MRSMGAGLSAASRGQVIDLLMEKLKFHNTYPCQCRELGLGTVHGVALVWLPRLPSII